jgi:hypothetical protein
MNILPAILITSPPDPFDVPLYCFRNQDWNPDFEFSDIDGNPIDLSIYQLAFIVAPLIFDSQDLGAPVLINKVFTIDSEGSAVFSFPDILMTTLSTRGRYRWFLESRALGASSGSDVITSGPLYVLDSPAFPP